MSIYFLLKKRVFTVNTDFSQSEVDDEVLQLDQYSIFIPEKRQFFLENSDLIAENIGPRKRCVSCGTLCGRDNARTTSRFRFF